MSSSGKISYNTYSWQDFNIRVRSDGRFNKDDLFKVACPRTWEEYSQQEHLYIKRLLSHLDLKNHELIDDDVWCHPRLAIHIAHWISNVFGIRIEGWAFKVHANQVIEWYKKTLPENKQDTMLQQTEAYNDVSNIEIDHEKFKTFMDIIVDNWEVVENDYSFNISKHDWKDKNASIELTYPHKTCRYFISDTSSKVAILKRLNKKHHVPMYLLVNKLSEQEIKNRQNILLLLTNNPKNEESILLSMMGNFKLDE